jgi:FHA domain-containing protein
VITCPKCSKDNQDHYKFCLGCGAELPRGAAPKPFSPQTPPQGLKNDQAPAGGGLAGTVALSPAQAAPLPRPAPAAPALATPPGPTAPVAPAAPANLAPASPAQATPAPPPMAPPITASTVAVAPTAAVPAVSPAPALGGATIVCPQCGHLNAPSNLFCGSCGFRLGGAAVRPVSAPALAPLVPEPAAGSLVLTALRADGSEAGTYQVPAGSAIVGRETGSIFAGDSYLSPRHASFRSLGLGRASVKDEGSLNGVYKRLARDVPTELRPNEIFRIGQEIIRFEQLAPLPPAADGVERLGAPSKGYVGRIALVIGREETGNAFPIPESGVHLGRERGDILFPEDGYVSGLHCRLSWDGRKLFLTDLGSSNGTFLRVADAELRSGDVLLMGQQLFRVAL